MGGHVDLDAVSGRILLDSLPSLIRLQAGGREAEKLQWLIGQLVEKFRGHEAGSGFATRFREIAGVTPLAYVTQWRMHLAERALRDEKKTIAMIAQSVGYASEAAFSNAFKRVMGASPTRFRTYQRQELTETRKGEPVGRDYVPLLA
ncbi:helix-turn-helix transcriptional regulator [Komagataeibacter europaeus]|uniref:helix-turn-helix transcriptional regulator n=1 Tax=Komagataeibacter europaeus TaxID=33995 RepID=UPI002174F1A0|nr:helix-turn-helix transcriptional regulator [Komagataeibacter europaeus]